MGQAISYVAAERVGTAMVRPGPAARPQEAKHLVTDLRRSAGLALGYVAEITGLDEACAVAQGFPVRVVDRRGFVRANVNLAKALTEVAFEGEHLPWTTRFGAGAQLGAALALLSARVLGQFDPFGGHPERPGQVLLVAPNVFRFERLLDADPRDFHLWIALHELTHAAQIAAAPWLPDWIRDRLTELVAMDESPGGLARLLAAGRRLPNAFDHREDLTPHLVGFLSPAQSFLLGEITATMSLLEGHADVIMDAVGPKVVKSVDQLRPKFDARRVAHGHLDRVLRRLAGMEAKTAQYVQGAGFVRGVLARVGHEGLNRVWSGPDNLPAPAELEDPAAWCARVVG